MSKRKKELDTNKRLPEELEEHLLKDDAQAEEIGEESQVEGAEETLEATMGEEMLQVEESVPIHEADDVEERVNALLEEIERLQSQANEYLDGWQRARAEFANFKKRTDREMEEARSQIASEILAKYLDILDDLELALMNPPSNDETQAWTDGIKLIQLKLNAMLEAEGVETILVEGDTFDPNFHEAITYEENEDHQDGQVIETVQKGYKLGDRVLRPAKVRVAK
ncbi:MAG TPA: nucleotide exchange factor GrpE [Anaerolineae bacterium]|nr:nucleotide exchange factor GrpE [Anaerolineae bacterium]